MPSPPAGGRRNRRRVYAAHYPATIFSSWMLAEPFLGLFEDGRLLACGGVTVSNRAMGAANLGNVLTHSGHRGRGLARTVVCSLVGIGRASCWERVCQYVWISVGAY